VHVNEGGQAVVAGKVGARVRRGPIRKKFRWTPWKASRLEDCARSPRLVEARECARGFLEGGPVRGEEPGISWRKQPRTPSSAADQSQRLRAEAATRGRSSPLRKARCSSHRALRSDASATTRLRGFRLILPGTMGLDGVEFIMALEEASAWLFQTPTPTP
jgi:hypothetical protein